jgi:hypothetical protein
MTDQNKRQIGAMLDAELYKQAKAAAILQGRKVGEVIDDAIRAYLEAQASPVFSRKKSSK